MTFHVSLQSQKIVNLYPGMAADAPAHESDWLQPTVDTVTYSRRHQRRSIRLDIPVAAVDADFQLAILGTKAPGMTIRSASPMPSLRQRMRLRQPSSSPPTAATPAL